MSRSDQICTLNDELRCFRRGGRIMITRGIQALGTEETAAILVAVSAFGAFTADNDPYREHDFGNLTIDGVEIFFKIDYYDRNLEFGSPDPADPAVTTRVLTIMLASEY
jgi:hypothetical protein